MPYFDAVFLDVTTYKPYDSITLKTEPLGGTEASTVRVAEGLGKLGLRTAVVEHCLDEPIEGDNTVFLPLEYIKSLNIKNLISMRGTALLDNFASAKKFSWHQDLPSEKIHHMRQTFIDNDVTVVGVSRWHKHAIQEAICDPNLMVNPRVKYIYNPVPDELYISRKKKVEYSNHDLVWLSSPHKGLDKALELFERIKYREPSKPWKLHIFNPGYLNAKAINVQGVVVHGPKPCKEVWEFVKSCLCVFYPCQFKETFGCIAAESNALHTPVATYELAALCETTGPQQRVSLNNEQGLIDMVIRWANGERPEAYGNKDFKLTEVLKQWTTLLRR